MWELWGKCIWKNTPLFTHQEFNGLMHKRDDSTVYTHRVVSLWPKPIQMMYSSPHPPSLCWDGRASHALCYGRCWYYILWYLCDICNENNGGQSPVVQSISKCFPNFRKFRFSVSSNTRLRSLQNFAHTPTAVLSGHVQSLVVITLILLKL